MKVTDYIVKFLRDKGVTDIFGYPGGVICHLIDSVSKYEGISAHLNYNEQGAALAACGNAQATKKIGVAYSTSGPGATNLVTGIANAYFDSVPCLFITGQVDTYAFADGYGIRQRGFQETNVVSVVKDISKWAVRVDNPNAIKYCMEKAIYIATSGNPGPVVIDIPADIQRAEIDENALDEFSYEDVKKDYSSKIEEIQGLLSNASRPVFLVGNGVKIADAVNDFRELVDKCKIPTVFSLPAFDVLPTNHPNNYGFIGTNGHRYSNFILAKSDLIISMGSRMDIRQIGLSRRKFNPNAKLVRIDIDEEQLKYKVKEDEYSVCAEIKSFIIHMTNALTIKEHTEWKTVCEQIKSELFGYDNKSYHELIYSLSQNVPDDYKITVDVGQHQLWVAQAFRVKQNQAVYMSAGHGTMGYSIPAAIGVYYASRKPVLAICGDGGFMMNLQELQYIQRERLPILIICINNRALGMIRGFQERNFNQNYLHTTENSGYMPPDLKGIAKAFGLKYLAVSCCQEVKDINMVGSQPTLVEIVIDEDTVLEPNFGGNGVLHDQLPFIDREMFDRLEKL